MKVLKIVVNVFEKEDVDERANKHGEYVLYDEFIEVLKRRCFDEKSFSDCVKCIENINVYLKDDKHRNYTKIIYKDDLSESFSKLWRENTSCYMEMKSAYFWCDKYYC